jgi:hypothetical protein
MATPPPAYYAKVWSAALSESTKILKSKALDLRKTYSAKGFFEAWSGLENSATAEKHLEITKLGSMLSHFEKFSTDSLAHLDPNIDPTMMWSLLYGAIDVSIRWFFVMFKYLQEYIRRP